MKRSYSSLIVAVTVTFLAACSSGGSGGSFTAPPTSPTTWHVQAGASTQHEAYQGLSFYPKAMTIDAGDTITWSFPAGEPHTVTLLGPRSSPPPPNDPSVAQPAGGSTYDGSTYTSSGFLLGGKTYSLTFTKPGTYTVYCLIHGPEMMETVTVQAAGAAYPQTQTVLDTQEASAEQADLQAAAASLLQFPYTAGGTHIAAGISNGLNTASSPATSSVVRFVDDSSMSSTTTVAVGTTVTWTNLSSNLPHTVTFPVAGQPLPAMPPFSPPSGPSSYDGTQLVNSGVLMPGQNFSLTFTKAGTYTYDCLFHDDDEGMTGTIVVQ